MRRSFKIHLLTPSVSSGASFFTPFKAPIAAYQLPEQLTFLTDGQPHPLCLLASEDLQDYLQQQTDWQHNFGLKEDEEGPIIGKMFGVLVVQTEQNELGYLAAFSGKLAGGNHHARFVPPVFDTLAETGFLNDGMKELTQINHEINVLEETQPRGYEVYVSDLKEKRKNHSIALQQALFDSYHFLNAAGEEKSLNELFKNAAYKNPPSGAGECAAPKLLQYAFQHNMKPLALAEFWWGQSPKSDFWQHGHFYPCCREKCEPILAHMLS